MTTPSATCKACNVTSNGMICIYEHPNGLDSMYSFVLGIEEINVSDALCVPCYDDLKIAYNFKQKCMQTELVRRNAAKSLSIKDEQNEASVQLPSSSGRTTDPEVDEQTLSSPCDERIIEIVSEMGPRLSEAQSSSEIQCKKHAIDRDIESILELSGICDNDADFSEAETIDRDKFSTEHISNTIPLDSSIELTATIISSVFTCNDCGKTFNRSGNLRRHQKMIHFMSTNKIGSKIGRTRNLRGISPKLVDNDVFTNLKETQCEFCFQCFESEMLRSEHELSHKSEEKPYRCNFETCASKFKDRFGLRKHLDTHSSVKKYQCRYCDQRFHQRGNARSHERYHTGEKPYICDHCGKSFAESGNLKAHIRFHTGERPYKCPECPKRFTTHYSHKIHIRSHTKEKPYLCNSCGKRFSSSGKLLVHRRIHSGQRPYKCDVCSAAFVDSSGLKRHSKIH